MDRPSRTNPYLVERRPPNYREPKAPRNGRSVWWVPFRNAFVTILVMGTLTVAYLFYISRDLPSLRQLQDFSPEVATKIISRDGKLIAELYTQQRVLLGAVRRISV